MGEIPINIQNAFEIKKMFRNSGQGCLETTLAAFGGNFEFLQRASVLRLNTKWANTLSVGKLINEVGLTAGRTYSIENSKKSPKMELEEELGLPNVRGILVLATEKGKVPHAFGIIHRNILPDDEPEMKKKNGHLRVDVNNEFLLTTASIGMILLPNRNMYRSISVIKSV